MCYRLEPSAPLLPIAPPLKGFQILLIICGILFLSLVLLGLGCSYYLLKRRRVQVVRRHPFSTGTGSEITKLTGSSLSNISLFEGLKIPRAHAAPASGSSSGSDAALISGGDTLPSDYPSESPSSAHSEVEDIDTRSLHRSVSSHGSYENKAFIHQEASSVYSEGYGHHTETEIITAASLMHRKPPPPEPRFDVQVRVKRAPPPPPSPTPPPSESEASMKMQERNLTTILEREELVRSSPRPNIQSFTYVPELHPPPPPAKTSPPPIYSKVIRKQPTKVVEETWVQEDTVDMIRRRPSLHSLNTEMTDTRSMSEIVERSHQKRAPPPPPIAPQMYSSGMEITTTELLEPPVVVSRRPEITSHVVDDVFLRTITEKRTIEDIERHRRQTTEYHQKPQPPPPKWDVTIRNYPNPDPHQSGDEGTTDWESYSETSSLSSYPTPKAERHKSHRNEVDIHQSYRTTLEIPTRDPSVKNWDVLIRVLEPPLEEATQEHHEIYRVEQTLSLEDRKKWREIITTESTLRTLLTEATIKEDYERIRKDQRYEKIFEPPKWDVIIRVLAPPEKPQYDQKGAPGNNRYRRKADWDTRSRRSSLPTLYEYDSDGGSSIRTLTADGNGPPGVDPLMRSRRTSRSSLRSDMDVRSMSEVTVDFAQRNMPDNMSDASSYYRPRRYFDDDYLLRPGTGSEDEDGVSLVRSMSQPSLARSASEFTEQWGVRGRQWDLSSPEHSPRSARSQRVAGAAVSSSYSVRQSSYQQSQGWFGDADSEASYK